MPTDCCHGNPKALPRPPRDRLSAIPAQRTKLPGAVQQIVLADRLFDPAGGMICHCVDGLAGQVLRTLPPLLVPRSNIPILVSPTTDFIGETFLEASAASIGSLLHHARSLQQDCVRTNAPARRLFAPAIALVPGILAPTIWASSAELQSIPRGSPACGQACVRAARPRPSLESFFPKAFRTIGGASSL